MALVRVLKKDLPFPADPEATAESVCGSAASHFEVRGGALSFYRVDDALSAEQLALRVASGRKAPDDVSFCVVEEGLISESGVKIIAVAGTTPFVDANQRHVDVTEVTLRRLSDTTVACVRGTRGVVKAEAVIRFLAEALVNFPTLKIPSEMKSSLQQTKVFKRIKRQSGQ